MPVAHNPRCRGSNARVLRFQRSLKQFWLDHVECLIHPKRLQQRVLRSLLQIGSSQPALPRLECARPSLPTFAEAIFARPRRVPDTSKALATTRSPKFASDRKLTTRVAAARMRASFASNVR